MRTTRKAVLSIAAILALMLLSGVALKENGAGAAAALAPGGDPIFVDSGQALGNTQSVDVALGDVDGDGDIDAYVASADADTLWRNDGSGGFSADAQTLSGAFGLSAALGDLDGDGDLDLFLGNSGPNEVWLNDGSGGFTDSAQQLGSANSNGVALADVDGDDDLDAVVANGDATSPANKLWLNDGSGGFSDSGELLGAGWSTGVGTGDLDGVDGPDIYFARVGFDELWLNDGNGHFTPDDAQSLSDSTNTGAALGDLDSDGDLDVWLATAPVASQVWLNDGQGSLSNSGQALGANRAVALSDVDGDLDLDAVAVRDIGGRSFDVWLNDGQAVFAYVESGASNLDGAALGNLDGQGGPDLFLVKNGPDGVWFNQLSVPSQADVSVSLPDTQYEPCESCFPFAYVFFTVTVRNEGPGPATDVVVQVQQGDLDWPYGETSHNFGTLAPGETATVELTTSYTEERVGLIEYIARADVLVTSNELDPNLQNNRAQSASVLYHCDYLCIVSKLFCEARETSVLPASPEAGSWLQPVQDAAIDLLVYYMVRDDVLAGTETGGRYINLFYTHNAEIQQLLGADASLKDEGIATLQLWEPNLWALVCGRGQTAVITAEQVEAVDSFLADLSAVASPALQQSIAEERGALPAPESFVGMTMQEARGLVVGYGTFLPVIGE